MMSGCQAPAHAPRVLIRSDVITTCREEKIGTRLTSRQRAPGVRLRLRFTDGEEEILRDTQGSGEVYRGQVVGTACARRRRRCALA